MGEVVELGLYQHYKGALYLVIMLAWESTNGRPRELIVVYRSLEQESTNVRRAAEFVEPVKWPDGVVRTRFARVARMEVG